MNRVSVTGFLPTATFRHEFSGLGHSGNLLSHSFDHRHYWNVAYCPSKHRLNDVRVLRYSSLRRKAIGEQTAAPARGGYRRLFSMKAQN